MSNKLVVYFSASGVTKNAAEKLAKAAGADIFEIRPAVPYTRADLNWMDKNSRSSKEMNDAASRPEIAALPQDMSGYDTVFIGFPIWREHRGKGREGAESKVPRRDLEARQDAERCIRQRHRRLAQPALRLGAMLMYCQSMVFHSREDVT